MLPKARDRFEEWLHAPFSDLPDDPRFEVRRAGPAEFDGIFDLLDSVFGVCARAVYEWLYQRNPLGLARCWVVAERESRRHMFVDISSVSGIRDLDRWQLVPGDADAE